MGEAAEHFTPLVSCESVQGAAAESSVLGRSEAWQQTRFVWMHCLTCLKKINISYDCERFLHNTIQKQLVSRYLGIQMDIFDSVFPLNHT